MLIRKIKDCTSAVDMLNMKTDILKHLEEKEDKHGVTGS